MRNIIFRKSLQWGVIVLFLGISISLVVAEIITTITKVMLDKFLVYYILLGLEILLAHFYFIFGYYLFFSIMAIMVMAPLAKQLSPAAINVSDPETISYYVKEINLGVLMILTLHYGYWALVMAKGYKKSPPCSIIWKK